MQYVCAELVNNVCQLWVEYSWIPPLSDADRNALFIAFSLLIVTAAGMRLLIRQSRTSG